jgi:hypothetical protein
MKRQPYSRGSAENAPAEKTHEAEKKIVAACRSAAGSVVAFLNQA